MSPYYLTYDITDSIYETTCSVRATYTLNMRNHSHYLCPHTHSFYDITLDICVASFALYKTSHPHFLISNHHFEDITPTILDIVSTLSVSSQKLYQWYHSHYIYDITSSICEAISPLYLWHCTHYVWHHNTLCWLHHTRHIWMTSFVLQKRSHLLYLIKPQSLWLHIHFRNHITHLYQTSHQLYLCHHNLSTDITATFVWHHTHYMFDIICTIYNIISDAYFITLLYFWQHNLGIWHHIQYAVQNIHYLCDMTVTNLCHHTHCIESITPTLCMTSHSL